MNKVGVVVGKFAPFHRGHLSMILKASAKVEKLYVVISHDRDFIKERCEVNNIKPFTLEQIETSMNIELQNFKDHITIVTVDETGIPAFPHGWKEWSNIVKHKLAMAGLNYRDIDCFLGSEEGYDEPLKQHFHSGVEYVKIDVKRQFVDISATRISEKLYDNWDMIVGSMRPHFLKKVLITGTESCGKTTLTQKLAKIYMTSWSEEYGKWYQRDHLGDCDSNWQTQDFETIAMRQLEQDHHAYRTGNRVSFVDSDAIVTQFYLDMYLQETSVILDSLAAREVNKWDLVIMLQPTVKWVQDGTRWNSEDDVRWQLHNKLKKMYDDLGIKYVEIGGDYDYRMTKSIELIEALLGKGEQ